MKTVCLFIAALAAIAVSLSAADSQHPTRFVSFETMEEGLCTITLTNQPVMEPGMPHPEMHSIWLSNTRRLCIPACHTEGIRKTSQEDTLMQQLCPDISPENQAFSSYVKAIEDGAISVLLWRLARELYYSSHWRERTALFIPVARTLRIVDTALFPKADYDAAEDLIKAHDHRLMYNTPSDVTRLMLEKFVDPDEPLGTPHSFVHLCEEQLWASINDKELQKTTLKNLWNATREGIKEARTLFIMWLYNQYSIPVVAEEQNGEIEEQKSESDPDDLLAQGTRVIFFDKNVQKNLAAKLSHCAETILELPRRGARAKDAREEAWVESLMAYAKELRKSHRYEAAVALYLFIEDFSQENHYKHLIALGKIYRYTVRDDLQAAKYYHQAVERGYPCSTPLARYLAKQNIIVTPEDRDTCCGCCSTQ